MPKATIRRSTFETNSSSMHTIVITTDSGSDTAEDLKCAINDYMDIDVEKEDFYLKVPDDNSYGRGFQLLSEPLDKIFYTLAALPLTEYNIVLKILQKYIPTIKGFEATIGEWSDYEYYFKDYDDTIPVAYSPYSLNSSFGEIDHQSTEVLSGAIKTLQKDLMPNSTYEDLLEKIIFDKQFIIVEDSDESCTLREYLSNGVLNPESFKYVYHERYDSKLNEFYGVFETPKELLKDYNDDE